MDERKKCFFELNLSVMPCWAVCQSKNYSAASGGDTHGQEIFIFHVVSHYVSITDRAELTQQPSLDFTMWKKLCNCYYSVDETSEY